MKRRHRMEKPEEKIMNEVETPERNRDWMESVKVPVPLNELMKMKDRIFELEKAVDRAKQDYIKQRDLRWEVEKKLDTKTMAYEVLKADYQKLLGMDEVVE